MDKMHTRFILYLDSQLTDALIAMAQEDCRVPRQQLIWLARNEAARRGLLKVENTEAQKLDRAAQTCAAVGG